MSLIFACHFRKDNQTGFARLVGGLVLLVGSGKENLCPESCLLCRKRIR